jgi:hypothetical protein
LLPITAIEALSDGGPGGVLGRAGGSMAMDPQQDGPAAPLSLAAARAMFRAPQASNVCWADVELPDGSVRACGRPEATSLGLCPEHRLELFGLDTLPPSQ